VHERDEICVCGHLRSYHFDIRAGAAGSSSCTVPGCSCNFFYQDQLKLLKKKEEEQGVALKVAQATTKLEDALWWQLRVILKKPFNAKTLKELERTARLARELLIVAKGGGVPTRSRGLSVDGAAYFGDDIDDELTPAAVPPAETFGAASIRELVSALRKQNEPSLVSLVHALKDAKDMGLEDVAKDLEAQIKKRQDEADQSAAVAAAIPAGGTPCGGDL
jgi:hypothetical protein